MTIERLSFPKGIPVDSAVEALLVATRHIKEFRKLEESEDIEPPYLKRFKYKRRVELSPSGNSALIGPNSNPDTDIYTATNVKSRHKDGSFRLNEPGDTYVVVGPGPKKGEARMYEYVRYVLSPKTKK